MQKSRKEFEVDLSKTEAVTKLSTDFYLAIAGILLIGWYTKIISDLIFLVGISSIALLAMHVITIKYNQLRIGHGIKVTKKKK